MIIMIIIIITFGALPDPSEPFWDPFEVLLRASSARFGKSACYHYYYYYYYYYY